MYWYKQAGNPGPPLIRHVPTITPELNHGGEVHNSIGRSRDKQVVCTEVFSARSSCLEYYLNWFCGIKCRFRKLSDRVTH